jgi:acetate kinase
VNVLSVNVGSSSLKCAIHEFGGRERRLYAADVQIPPSGCLQDALLDAVKATSALGFPIHAVGHRFVFGGTIAETSILSHEVVRAIEDVASLDPLHSPQALSAYRAFERAFPDAAQVAAFDTEFFRSVPSIARVIPIPQDDPLLRRYGFHGLSYEYVAGALGKERRGRTVVAHLGSGSSLAALKNGKPVDMTMGFSALGGLMMATRPGDLDPGVLLYLLERRGYDAASLREMLETRSGLRALAGTGSLREISAAAEAGDEAAAFALACYARSIAKGIGALAAVLGGLDRMVFTGGVGERDAGVRSAVVRALEFLGGKLHKEHNRAGRPVISADRSKIGVMIVATDENLVVSRHVRRCLERNSAD